MKRKQRSGLWAASGKESNYQMIKIAQSPAIGSETVHLYPSKGNWGIIALFSIIGFAPLLLYFAKLLPTTVSGQVLTFLYAAVFLAPCGLFGYWQIRAIVIADDTGLRWRGLGRWRTANWNEITDYYEQFRPKAKTIFTIVTKSAKLNINPALWIKPAEIKKIIASKALNAQVRDWDFLGTRSNLDWPRTFTYNTNDNRFVGYALPGMLAVCFGLYAWNLSGAVFRAQSSLGLGWAVATIGISLFGILPLVLMSSLILRMRSSTARRSHQHITLNIAGLIFDSVGCRIESRWEDIKDLRIRKLGIRELAPSYSVVTTQGTFDFSPSISEFQILCSALATHAVGMPEKKWHSEETDVLGGTATLWSSRCEGIGKRIYHYRTRTNRSLLSLALFFAVMPILSILIQQWAGIGIKGSPTFAFGLSLFCGIPVLLGIWRYSKAKIEIDTEGITQQTLLGSRYLAWAEIEDYYQSGDDIFKFGIIKCKDVKLWFWAGIANAEDLKSEIQRQAINSLNRTWDRDSQDEQKK